MTQILERDTVESEVEDIIESSYELKYIFPDDIPEYSMEKLIALDKRIAEQYAKYGENFENI